MLEPRMMPARSVDDVMRHDPCPDYPRERVEALFAPHGGRATLAEAMVLPIPARDRYWLATRPGLYLSDAQLRLVACGVAESALLRERAAGREPDARSWAAVEAGRRHARGEIDDAALRSAWSAAAWSAAAAAAWSAAAAAAWSAAAWSAAAAAAWSARATVWEEAIAIVARVAGIEFKGGDAS